jgi:N-hydroxyarylamine O-acetyltransferase
MRAKAILPTGLTERALEKLGFQIGPQTDFHGLAAVYRAWGESVPFDNAAKLIALRSGAAGNLPGIDAQEFFTNFLQYGIGGTCWTSSNALYSFFLELGFNVKRLAGSMRDTGIISHGTTKARIDGADWLIDSSMLTREPLPLSHDLHIGTDPIWGGEVEYTDGTHIIWWDAVPSPEFIPCRLLPHDVEYDFYLERYEASRTKSPFNERIYVRRNFPESILVITGNRHFVKSANGVEATVLTEPQLEERLAEEAGFSPRIIDRLRACGAIKASMIPPDGPPPPIPGVRPSKRITQ